MLALQLATSFSRRSPVSRTIINTEPTDVRAVDPRKRFTIEECLSHPYLEAYHDPEDEPTATPLEPGFFDFDLMKDELSREELKRLLCVKRSWEIVPADKCRYEEIMTFQPA
jgi:mitogen-activated protein kinase 1/3